MAEKHTLTTAKINDLVLDINNPRFAQLYSSSGKEEDLIEYLLFNESAEEIAKAISASNEFYPDRPLWVLQVEDKFLVRDGNRRCAAIKALARPKDFELELRTRKFEELPVLIYHNPTDLENRILNEHTNNLFKQWDRIAKALEVDRIYNNGSSFDTIRELDSNPSQLLKLASFYYESVKIGGEDLKKLLRRGRGRTGGKTIIFERLFSFSRKCGYYFLGKPSYEIKITDQDSFISYINALIEYLKLYPSTKTQDIDTKKEGFLDELIEFGFKPKSGKKSNKATSNKKGSKTRSSTKKRPTTYRKNIAPGVKKTINECFSLKKDDNPNAKTAMVRIAFECTLKFVIENTAYNGTYLCDLTYFQPAFYGKNNTKLPYTNFNKLKNLFSSLITVRSDKKAFEALDLDRLHQVIHNYKVGATPADSDTFCDNLIPLIEFMLQEENDLLKKLDTSKF